MGTGQASHLVNVIDFGLAKKFRDHEGAHIPYKQDPPPPPPPPITALEHHSLASINTHHGIGRFCFSHCFRIGHTYGNPAEASPRDDLESLSYMLVYFLRGTLPWRKLKAATVAGTWDLIRDAKLSAGPELHTVLPPRVFHVTRVCSCP